ncbi:hypothetical protein RFI_03719 [Reticulomyxa filosa]|uniref:Uncharacterized protein n=1 Tax=Reticulomyxa filosa TaxID=46433 RepID=X6P6Z4_RETFI|nr:hypothetical protein RFI_03719 [Reticulomyxa filosa]|eukprot:ETO33387.1 hypothetical protein RFI_03719 [Reticulomyxa filosa]
MSYKTFVCLEEKTHEVALASLNLKNLEERTLELIKMNNNGSDKTVDSIPHFKIVDNNGQDIANDQQLKNAFETPHTHFFVHSIDKKLVDKKDNDNDEKKDAKDEKKEEKENEYYKIMNPLVLLTGAAKYENKEYLPEVKIDLLIALTYNPNKPETEILTLNGFDAFFNEHCLNLNKNNNINNNDALIFVWCGHGSTNNEEDIFITSDDKSKNFKSIQELFTHRTDVFLNKPKIFIKNAYRGNELSKSIERGEIQTQQWYNKEADTLIVFPTISDKQIYEGSYFTQFFCDSMTQNISSPKPLEDNLSNALQLLSTSVNARQTIESITTLNRHILLYNKTIESENKLWIKANKEAHEMVNEMINNKQQGIIVIAINIDQLAKSNNQLSQQNISFSMMINSNQYMKKKLIIGQYSICSFHSKNIIFDNITIDGCVYVVDCIIDTIGNCDITQQLIHTNDSVIRCHFNSPVFTCLWPIDTSKLMQLGIDSFDIQNLNKTIELQTLHDYHVDVAESYLWLGRAYDEKEEYDKSIEYYEKSLKIYLDKLGHDNTDVSTLYNNLGLVYYNKGEYDKSMEYHEKSLKIDLDKLGHDHHDVTDSYHNLGSVYRAKGEYDKAIEYYEKSLKIKLDKLGSNHIDIASLYNDFGLVYRAKGEYDKAIECHEKSLKIRLDKLESDQPNISISYNNLGLVYRMKGEYNKAIEYHEKSLQIKLDTLRNDHPSVATSYNNLGYIYYNKEEYDKAMEYHEKSLKIRLSKLGHDHPDISISYNNLGTIYGKKGEYDKAMEYHNKSLKIRLNKLGSDHLDVSFSYKNLALVYCGKQEYDKAMEFGKKALELRLKKLDSNHRDVGVSYDILGDIYCKKEDKMEAKKCFESALSIYTQKLGKDHQDTQKVISKLKNL